MKDFKENNRPELTEEVRDILFSMFDEEDLLVEVQRLCNASYAMGVHAMINAQLIMKEQLNTKI